MYASSSHSDTRLIAGLQRFAAVAAVVTTLVGALVLVGWVFNLDLLKSIVPGQASMKPWTALGLVLGGAALWLRRAAPPIDRRPDVRWRRLALVCAGVMAALGGLILLEYLLGVNLGFDQWLFRQALLAENGVAPIGRPSPASAVCLVLLGAALLALDAKPTGLALAATLLALLVSGLALLGYAYDVSFLHQGGPYVSMALHTALAFVLLSLGLLAARPTGPVVGVLTTHLAGSVLSRRLLPAIFVVPFVLGWLRLFGQRLGLYDTGFGVALMAIANVVVFAALVYASARLLNKTDASREAVHAALREREERLRVLADATPNGLITVTPAGVIEWSNRRAEVLFGYGPGQLPGRPLAELVPARFQSSHPAYRQGFVADPRARAMGAGRDLYGLRQDQTEFPVEIDLSPHNGLGDRLTLASISDITARRQAEEALRQLNAELEARVEQRTADLAVSELKFRTLFEVLPVGVSILDDQRRVVNSNPALARIMKMTSAGLAAGAYTSRLIIHPDGTPVSPEDLPSVRVIVEQRPIFHMEMGISAENEDPIWVDVSAAPLPVDGFSAVVATADLTERKRIEAALGESEEKFSRAFHASATGIVITRMADGRIIEVNDSFLRLIGFERDEVMGRTNVEIGLFTAPDRDRLLAVVRAQGSVHELELGLPTMAGEMLTIQTSIEPIKIGKQPCLLSIHQDITDRKRIEQALASERAQLEALMDNIPDAIYFKDPASRFARINLAQARMLGLPAPASAIGRTDVDFLAAPLAAEFAADEQRLFSTGQAILDHVEFNPTPAGEPRWLSSSKVPLKDDAGRVIGLVGISRDITGRMQAEQELQRLNRRLAVRVNELSLLSQLDEQLQACATIADTYACTAAIMRQLFPDQPGALYVVDAGRTRATTAASWGAPALPEQVFALEDCGALSLGELQWVDPTHPGPLCRHITDLAPLATLCVPLLAQGQVLGLLHLHASQAAGAQTFAGSTLPLPQVVADSVALTWSNLTLGETLRRQASHDPLTELFNRRFMEASLARELHRAARGGHSIGMLMIDVDHFKQINDRHGHDAGDTVLRAIGRLLTASSRGSDIPCRYGGEEFLLILPEASLEITRQRAEQIRASFQTLPSGFAADPLAPITLSMGVAAYPQHGDDLEAVLRAADAALYRAKAEGRVRTMVAFA